jgi:hypothetical protein
MEEPDDPDDNNGWTQQMGLSGTYPFPQRNSADWERGLPLHEYYKSGSKLVKSKHYDYDLATISVGANYSVGIHSTKYRVHFIRNLGSWEYTWDWGLYGRYIHIPRWQVLKQVKERSYAPDGLTYMEVVNDNTHKKVFLNNKEYLFLDQVKTLSNSKNEQVITKFRYPLDYSQTYEDFGNGIARLKASHVYGAVVEQYKYLQDQSGNNKRYISGILNKFDANKPVIKRTYTFQPASVTSTFNESHSSNGSFVHDGNYRPVLNFNVFDNVGNILEHQKENDVKESFVWDHGSSLPIAKAINASSDRIAFTSFESDGLGGWSKTFFSFVYSAYSFTGKKCFNGTLSKTVPSGNYIITLWVRSNGSASISGAQTALLATVGDWKLYEFKVYNVTSIQISANYIDEVRLYPQGAQMTSYTFLPGVGIATQNDVNNRVSFFEYDGLGRLRLIRDQNRNVIKTYEYNYKQ